MSNRTPAVARLSAVLVVLLIPLLAACGGTATPPATSATSPAAQAPPAAQTTEAPAAEPAATTAPAATAAEAATAAPAATAAEAATAAPAADATAAGAAASTPADQGQTTAMAPRPEVQATLTIWGWDAAIKPLQLVDQAFTQVYPNVKLEYVPRPPADTYQQLQLAASAGAGLPDISVIEDSHLAQLVELGVLADISGQVQPYVAKMNEYKWNQAQSDGKYYAMPWDSGPVAVFYRRDVFEKAGVDPATIKTWEDYYQAARTIKEKAGVPMWPQSKARNSGRLFEALLWQQGLGYVDQEGKVILDTDPRIEQTLEYMGRFWKEELASDQEEWTDPWYKDFADGKVASFPAAVWMGTFFKSFIAPDAQGQWGVFKLPVWPDSTSQASNDGGSALAIFESSQQKEAAWAYVEFHLGLESSQLTMYRETDIFPSLETTYTDPFYQEPDPYFADQPVRALFSQVVTEIPNAGIYTADYQEMNSLLTPEIQKFALGQQTAKQALANAASAIRDRTSRQ